MNVKGDLKRKVGPFFLTLITFYVGVFLLFRVNGERAFKSILEGETALFSHI